MKNFKIIKAFCLILCIMMAFASCDKKHTTEDCLDENKDHKCDVCSLDMGKHADSNKDHVCDYGCGVTIGVCEDIDKDHVCDYGCSKVIGECTDADKNHACDYGCGKLFGECVDTDNDHACDYGCGKGLSGCTDENPKDHKCDVCEKAMGDPHVAAEDSHNCAYCGGKVSDCVDTNPKDHACDVCGEPAGDEHAAAEGSHNCAYCGGKVSDCVDTNPKDHACDVCGEPAGDPHVAAEGSHNCAYCGGKVSDCVDTNPKDHKCDVCGEPAGDPHVAAEGSHDCAYCQQAVTTCDDAENDGNHACDVCGKAVGQCSDVLNDDDHNCDECGAEGVTSHVYGEWEKNNADTHKHICNCGDVQTEDHQWNNGEETLPATHTAPGVITYTCTVCSETKTSDIPVLTEHTYNQKNIELEGAKVSDATCTALATYKYSCICGVLGTETFEAGEYEDHTESAPKTENAKAATCAADGSYDVVVYCSVCETFEISRKTEIVPATGHKDTDGDLFCDNDACDEQFYVITLDGVTATATSNSTSTVANAFVAGEKVTLTADAYKTVGEARHMFVGFDLNKVDNRISNDGSTTVTYTMPAENVSVTAKYAEANTTFFTTGTFNAGGSYNPEGMSGTAITDSTDPDLEGLSGWSFIITDNTKATDSKTNNITAVSLTAWGLDQDKLVRFVLKNTGNYDVTVELCAEYFGFMVTTGYVTVPANSVVVAFMDFGPFSGAGSTCDFMLHVREDMTGDGSGTIQLDVVAAAAKKYESKVSDFIVTSDKNVFMDFGEANESNTQANVSQASSSGMNMRYWDQYGVMYFYGNNNTSADTYARERANALGDYAIDLTNGEKITIYVKVTNLYHGGGGKYSLVFTRGSSALSGAYLATQVIEFTEYGESFVYKIEIDPTITGTSANLQFGLKKAKADGTGGKVDVLVQIASENIFGEEPVNQ